MFVKIFYLVKTQNISYNDMINDECDGEINISKFLISVEFEKKFKILK